MGRLAARSIEEAFAGNRFDRGAFDRYLRERQAEVQPITRRLRLFLGASQSDRMLDIVGSLAPARQAILRSLIKTSPALID